MIDRSTPVTEDELHAFVDGELPADRRDAVDAWLAAHPDDMARVAAWRAQADAIRARYDSVATEPVPARLALDRITARQRTGAASPRLRQRLRFSSAASAAALAAGLRAVQSPPRRRRQRT